MSAEAARRALSMTLPELVDRYRALSAEFGKPVPLRGFQLPRAETEKAFSSFDEDYHISRFLKFSEADGEKYLINGVPITHVAVDGEIETIL